MKKLAFVWFLLFALSSFLFGQVTPQEALRAIEAEEYNKAIGITNQLIKADPKIPENYFWKGYVYYKLASQEGITEELRASYAKSAKENFETGLLKNKKSAHNILGLGLCAALSGNYLEAKTNFDKAYEIGGKNVELIVLTAEAYQDIYESPSFDAATKKKAIDEADTKLRQALLVDEKNANIHVALGNLSYKNKVLEVAENSYRKAIQYDPKHVGARFALAKLLLRPKFSNEDNALYIKRLNEAKDQLLEINKIDPQFAPAYNELSQLYFKVDEYKAAEQFAEKYLNLMGEDRRARVRYAQLLYLIKQYPKAIAEFEKVIADTNSFVISRLYAYSLAEAKEYDKAQTAMEQFYRLVRPEQIIYKDYRYAAIIALNKGDSAKAEQNLEKLIQIQPEEVELYKDFYNYYKGQQKWSAAAKYLEIYINKKRSLTDKLNLGWIYAFKTKEYEKAEHTLKELIAERPDIIEAYSYLAYVASKLDSEFKEGRAKIYYERLLEQVIAQKKEDKYKKDIATAYNYLALYFYKIEKNDKKTLAYCLKSLALEPENEQMKKLAEGLKGQGVTPED
jgi:tetratricopeptide (TPR) repeat protein